MGVYELDIYAKTLYGAPLFVSFQSTMAAEQNGYGNLEVSWDTPIQASSSQILAGVKTWTRLRLVRNSYGIPETEDDGWVILESAAGTGSGAGDPTNRFLDDTVVPGQVYYYAVFVSTAPDTYSATTTYYPGDLVTYSSTVYINTQTATGLQPDTNPTSWSTTGITEAWYRCGGCVGLAAKDFKHSELLYDHIPRPYKVEVVESTASSIPVNEQLLRFCRLFGYFFDVMKCEHEQLLRMNDVLRCTDRQLYLLAQEMGVDRQLPGLPELRRSYIANAALIHRDRGSVEATTKLIKAMTGWDSDVLIGYNALHDLDEAAFASPAYPEWQRDKVYYTTVGSQLYSDIVTYSGTLYAAIGTPRRESIYLSYTGSNPTKTGTGTIVKDPDRVADPYPGYVRLNGAASGATLTFTFAAPSAGTYNLHIVPIADPAGGIITATVNGVASTMAPRDLYSSSRQQIPVTPLGSFTLTATGNTLTLTTTGKNALSSGYDITLSYLLIQGSATNLNVRPVGDASSATYWQAITPNTLKDTSTEWNPLTGGYGSWNLLLNSSGTVNPDVTSTSTPDWWISPQGASVGTSSPGTGNSLNYTALGTAGTREVFLSGLVRANAWDAANTYYPGQAVTWNPLGWATAPVYVATAQSVGRQPDLNPDKWKFTPYKANISPEASRILTDSVYAPKVSSWSATRSYQKGARIAWRGHLYEAARPSLGIFPTGYNADNLWWRWCGLNIQRYTFSVYHNRTATATGADVRPFVNWYNSNGTYGGLGFIQSDAQIQFDRFETTPTYPQSTGSAPAGWTVPAAGAHGVPIPWNVTRGSWANTRGVVRPTAWNSAAALERQAGRVLWFQRDWVYTTAPSGQQGEQAYVTFMAAPDDSGGTLEHGIVFRFTPNVGYWLASRDRLTYTTVTVSGGNVTAVNVSVVATWTPISYGERMRVRNRSGDILVEARGWSGWRTLANVSDTRNNTALGYGLLERVRT
ncbi:phage tail protein [Streptomyces sp. NPDC057002]|uniref:phage tail protein n=1 Tax=Streptomyces sp. NPDC057002 TaxID=3345992 RepID=UPI0036418569